MLYPLYAPSPSQPSSSLPLYQPSFPFNLCHSLPLILSSPPLYYSSPFHFIPHHPSLLCSSSYSWSPLIPCHPIFFVFYHLSSLPHIISFSLPIIIFPLYPMPSPPFHPHSPLPLIQHHLLLFITCHPFLLCHTIPSSLVAIFSSLFCVISFLFPITLLPYAISFPPVHPPSSLFHVFIPHHSLSRAILSSLLPITPSPYIISSIPSFYSTSPPFILCHLLFFISYQPLPLVSLPYLIFTCRSPLRASQLIPKVLS